jgi:adenine/guanine phosphoribosyltransferase-like PRPP-binding protein
VLSFIANYKNIALKVTLCYNKYIMHPKAKFEPIFGDYNFLKERLAKYEPLPQLIIPQSEELDLNQYIIKNHYDDPLDTKRLGGYEEKLSQNIIHFPKQSTKLYEKETSHLSEFLNLEANIIKTKSELLGKSLSSIAIQSLTETPRNKQNIPLNLPSSLLNVGIMQQPFNDFDFGATKPEDLPKMALPILEFMEDVRPHVVIGCDRGGRLFGLAIHAAWRQTRDGQPFPTFDGKLHFARVSKSEDPDVLQEKIDQIIAISKRQSTQRGNELADDEQLRVLFVDDWVIGGGTMRLAQHLMKKHGAQTYFATMCGQGGDVTGQPILNTHVSWHDRPEEIGVNYLSTLQKNPDGSISQRQEAKAVRGLEAASNRQRIQQAAKSLRRVRILEQVA